MSFILKLEFFFSFSYFERVVKIWSQTSGPRFEAQHPTLLCDFEQESQCPHMENEDSKTI